MEEKSKAEKKRLQALYSRWTGCLVESIKIQFYESLTDKVERILELWKEKTKDFERIYSDGMEVFKKIEKTRPKTKKIWIFLIWNIPCSWI